ncbi:MAG: phosphoglycerate dehydrogenase [Deltaproteobacteria bacterium]|nr:phosphoglycerate dehydrogenase [Deltaproteobacteria bacterium]
MNQDVSFPRDKIKILLLEGISPRAVQSFEVAGYSVQQESSALSEDELVKRIEDVHVLGIRSKTTVSEKVLDAANKLLSVGCFCIGTNQVRLGQAELAGIPVFNAPFANTRSVAELTMAEIVMLSRRASWRSKLLHEGVWQKSAKNSYEVRTKTLGIVGYGHIGQQVGILAESFGMNVVFYDIIKKLPLGNSTSLASLDELLEISDFVTLHVPETPITKEMIGAEQLQRMKQGSYLLNLSRGSVVQIEPLVEALRSKHLAGAALDVYPVEPKSNDEKFVSDLCGLENVILTPHIGGSTLEAQENIGLEVSSALLDFLENGSTVGAVNFPKIRLPLVDGVHRVLNVHKNVPGVLGSINQIMSEIGANIRAQYLDTSSDIGYLIMDVDMDVSKEVKEKINLLPATIRTRLLY